MSKPLASSLLLGRLWTGRLSTRTMVILGLVALTAGVGYELRTCRLQARLFSAIARHTRYEVASGPSSTVRLRGPGPYDLRLGYAELPAFLARLDDDYQITAQAANPRLHLALVRLGVFPIYHEKTQAGLTIFDRHGERLFDSSYPQRAYARFEAIPRLVVDTVMFVENRELLDPHFPYRNPAVEWDRLGRALLDRGIQLVYPAHKGVGGSTLATQLEKMRHSPAGRTGTAGDKLRQMVSASLRAYEDGEETLDVRRRIVLDYVNSIPLAAVSDFGEVHGLGDGLWAWYGAAFADVNARLERAERNGEYDGATALAYRQVLSLFVAHRGPSVYLVSHRDALTKLTDAHLRLLAEAGLISPRLCELALAAKLQFRERAPLPERSDFAGQKAANAIRTRLAPLLGVERVYDLDRLDLEVTSTLDAQVQREATAILRRLRQPEFAAAAGLRGPHLLERGDPAKVVYSLTLYERGPDSNQLRVQADNFDQPLDVNEGVKLELGSTAKLRTLVLYLQVVEGLHRQYAALPAARLRSMPVAPADRLTRWALDYLASTDERSLPQMLDAALERRYSASPAESFFTGGGRHVFANFDREDNSRVVTAREAFERSINLPFIRMMRDIVQYYVVRVAGSSAQVLEDGRDPLRRVLLSRFADREGQTFLRRFYRQHHGQSTAEMLQTVVQGMRPAPRRLAVIFRSVCPEAGPAELAEFLRAQLPESTLSARAIRAMWDELAPEAMALEDRGYLARVHPLELWLMGYLHRSPDASLQQAIDDSANERQQVYGWLFQTRSKDAQDIRIRTLLEVEAFLEIHRAWKRLGYPFESLVPSYATAIGSSADRPAALAELIGIVLADGMRLPTRRVTRFEFGAGTPFDTTLERRPSAGERVLSAEVAQAVRAALAGVVERGTARAAREAIRLSDGSFVAVGGKTGTGDNRREVYGPKGLLLDSRVVNRTAAFVFSIGDRFYGTVTAYVPGEAAGNYRFTSALAVQVFRQIAPALTPLLEAPAAPAAAPPGPGGQVLARSESTEPSLTR
ncbi:MAG TPA: transglycosylase domain-containing protein [Candidatus Polarisedimenticolaceae bacterium]|nr:transglycosylase domain-containing protein [Candidatus Polarisedimenticolaceae bacterium]